MKDINKKQYVNKEKTSKYGEFISSYFAWKSLDKQKEESDKLSNITKDKKE